MKTGSQLKEKGMKQAIDNANSNVLNWAEIAYNFLQKYAKNNPVFLAEDVRDASAGIVPDPPSQRAWGGIFARARKASIIKSIGIKKVTNPKAHSAFATHWGSLIN